MKTTVILLGGALLGCAAERGAMPLDPIPLGPPAGPVELIREANGSEQGGYDLFRPARPIPSNGSVWVLESGNDQLVRFDSTLTRAHSFGREGEGPGEIQFAMDVAREGDRLIVAEIGNSRLSIFDTAGSFRSTLSVAPGPRFIAIVGGQVVTAPEAITTPEYAYRVDERGRLTAHAGIPDPVRRLTESDPTTYLPAGPYIASSAAGDLFVLDQSVLALSRFDPRGRLVTVSLLPEPFRTALLERRLEQRKAWGKNAAAFVDSPAAKRISIDEEGRLLVLFPLPDSWGLLIDTKSWIARPLMLPENRRLHDILWATSDATLDGDRLYVISGHQLYQFAVDW